MSDVVLTPQEVQFILNELAGRDPVMRLLLEKQMQAQQAEAKEPQMRVVGDAA